MQILTTITRIVMGLILVLFGMNGFLGFLPQPEMPASAGAFFGALLATGYMIPLIAGTEVLVGMAFLSNRWVPLALAILGPILVNIIGFHLFLDPAGSGPGLVLTAMTLFLAWQHRDAYRSMLTTTPVHSERQAETPSKLATAVA